MEESSARTLADRVARLESTLRRDRTIALAALAILCATAQAPPAASTSSPVVVRGETTAELNASGVAVRDSNGRQRIFIGLDSKGRPSVDMTDSSGTLRQSMFLTSENMPILRQFDSSGTTRLEAYLGTPDQQPNLRLLDSNGKRRLSLFIGSDTKNPELAVYGQDEKARGYLVGEDGGAYFDIRDASTTFRAHMGLYTDGNIGMFVANTAGQHVWQQP